MLETVVPISVSVDSLVEIVTDHSPDRVAFQTFHSLFNVFVEEFGSFPVTFLLRYFEGVSGDVRNSQFVRILPVPGTQAEHPDKVEMYIGPQSKQFPLYQIALYIIHHHIRPVFKFKEYLVDVGYAEISGLPHFLKYTVDVLAVVLMVLYVFESAGIQTVVAFDCRKFVHIETVVAAIGTGGTHRYVNTRKCLVETVPCGKHLLVGHL